MDSFFSGIIDCVARPSTSDTPVRVLRKSPSESPKCISSTDAADDLPLSSQSVATDTDSDTASLQAPPEHVRSVSSAASLSRLIVPVSSVLTAEGIILGNDRLCGTCGDCAACYDAPADDDAASAISAESIDDGIRRQFEAAFATFLYKNPSFTSMSHTTLQKLRSKLLKESARNVKAEAELRYQLADLREAKRDRELELQRELLVVTRAKAAREAELILRIQKTRRASMLLEGQLAEARGSSSPIPEADVAALSSPGAAAPWLDLGLTTPPTSPSMVGGDSYEDFKKEIQKNKMEQAHILAEMEKLKMQIAEEAVHATTP
ncbi:hypothetical protein ACHAXT_006227 [Thalassiosira profunda]